MKVKAKNGRRIFHVRLSQEVAKGIYVIPDILANAGSVTVSYFEWVQNVQKLFWTEDDVNQRLDHIMTRAFKEVHSLSKKEKVNMRTAAYMLAIERVGRAKELRGIFS